MSVTFSGLGRDFTGDGMNEAGVSASILAHSEGGVVPPLSDPRPAIIRSQWIQYILDTSGSVVEAIQQAQKTRLIRNGAQVHYLVCDSSSQCVTFEYLNGNLVIHTGANLPYPVLANSTYSQSLNYFADLISHEDPYTILNNQSRKSLDRFSRAAIWSQSYSPQTDVIQYSFSALQNLAQGKFTQWSIVYSLQPLIVHLSTQQAPEIKSIDLSQFNPSCSSAVMILDMNSQLEGDVTAQFHEYTLEANDRLIDLNDRFSPAERAIVKDYPESNTMCLE